MAITGHTFEVPNGKPCTVFAETDNINYFLNNNLSPDAAAGPYNVLSTVKSSSRRQYPGDVTKINVAGHQRVSLVDPSLKSGNALPGRSFVLVERGGNKERRQFTLKGRVVDLHAFLRAEAAKDIYLFTSTGARMTIDAATAA
jgi:hypothetical protein